MPSQRAVRWLQTMNVNFIAVTYGMAIAVYGATLVDVAEIYGESIKTISTTLTARGLGSIFSSLLGSLIYKWVNMQIVLLGCVIFGAASALLTTVLPSLLYLCVLTFFIGCSMGLMEIGIHVWIQVLWKERSGSFFHLMNFMFGFGGIIGPFVCEPFLGEIADNTTVTVSALQRTQNNVANNLTEAIDPVVPDKGGTRIFTAFCIIAAIHALNAILMVISYCLDNTNFKPSKITSQFDKELPLIHRRIVLALLAIYLTVGVTCEFSFSSLAFAFAVSHASLKFTKSQAAYLTSLFWSSYTVSRIVTTGLSVIFSPSQLMIGSHIVYVSGALCMLLFLESSPALVTWIGTGVLAFGLSPYWANGTAWAVDYIQLTPGSMGLIMVLISSGVMLIPFFIGNQISENPVIFLYSNCGLAVLLSAIVVILIAYGNSKTLRKYKAENNSSRVELN